MKQLMVLVTLLAFSGCGSSEASKPPVATKVAEVESQPKDMLVGTALVGSGNEIAHVDVLIGPKSGPVGIAFARAVADQKKGYSNFIASIRPDIALKPSTVIVPKVAVETAEQSVQLYGAVQLGVAKGVADAVLELGIDEHRAEDLVIVCSVLVHWEAVDKSQLLQNNYNATRKAVTRAFSNEPQLRAVLEAAKGLSTDEYPK
ncbi:MAG: formaldehyde-activating enzyme [Planctomycetaceae bacterium]|nr:formaldehyde-activating enzyme [Planctomycetaceae bacterium]